MQVTVKSESGERKSWTIPRALLSHYSGYFTRLRSFKEGEEGTVVLHDFDPDVFGLFVEFVYYGSCSYHDDLKDHSKIRDSARAWVLGDYLDATEFKNFAMRTLHDTYFPSGHADPKVGISANAVDYCCKHTTVDSPLHNLYLKFAIRWWHRRSLIDYSNENRSEWNALWDKHASFRNSLLFWLNSREEQRLKFMDSMEEFMEKLVVTDEPSIPVT